ncbi:MAG: c-type cytochrome [Helicobacter sp.]|nr:c-type cytochrome [Helicobacter sp.]
MWRFFLLICSFAILFAQDESFITQIEYGKMLYENPRGIGCVECHGKNGEGKQIANFTHQKKPMTLYAPPLQSLSFKEFTQALEKNTKIMPKYYLTPSEIQAIYQYIEFISQQNQ